MAGTNPDDAIDEVLDVGRLMLPGDALLGDDGTLETGEYPASELTPTATDVFSRVIVGTSWISVNFTTPSTTMSNPSRRRRTSHGGNHRPGLRGRFVGGAKGGARTRRLRGTGRPTSRTVG
ncbi:hypothetical protein D8S78_11355 [Natrialba swarupiae]|nr:hypothetical protein [Natrialba swarupiae]